MPIVSQVLDAGVIWEPFRAKSKIASTENTTARPERIYLAATDFRMKPWATAAAGSQ